ncbi:ABC transporter ATP-binding protein [Albimonas pacifica]|uniref:Peptide/nickel transport system ATP-binding protein n=1 Tax=Albimonas pacifica TaxID=1114924 RepID=A0A1I3NCY5_9RHOB|nr:ABC transporter ATP-binding protein [Albimonas pacifica]SFJ07134.1 peptide/nickel transport system ATP-binding protein [Albimonas pacifica]
MNALTETRAHRPATEGFLEIRGLTVEHPLRGGRKVHAVTDLDLSIAKGETLGLVGESGCGKSSAARAILQLPRPTRGSVRLDGEELTALSGGALRRARRRFQMIFQDPIASLNPRRTVAEIVSAPLEIAGEGDARARRETVEEMLELVGLDPRHAMDRRPHEFSGGQCQRISIARALVLRPDLLVCDEPVSALDVSIQAQILNLLADLKARFGLTMLFISHDLAVVKNVSDRVAVMHLGRLCEEAGAEALYSDPAHPYTRVLLSAAPRPDPDAIPKPLPMAEGEPPSPIDPPSGCRFRTRCPRAQALCAAEVPPVVPRGAGHGVACHFPLD